MSGLKTLAFGSGEFLCPFVAFIPMLLRHGVDVVVKAAIALSFELSRHTINLLDRKRQNWFGVAQEAFMEHGPSVPM